MVPLDQQVHNGRKKGNGPFHEGDVRLPLPPEIRRADEVDDEGLQVGDTEKGTAGYATNEGTEKVLDDTNRA